MAWMKDVYRRPMLAAITALLLGAGCGDDKNEGSAVDGGDDSSQQGDGDDMQTPPDNTKDSGPIDQPDPTDDLDGGQDPDPTDGSVPPADGDASAPAVALPADGNRLSICYQAADCNGDDLTCYLPDSLIPGFCTEDCDEDKDCQAVEGLAATCSPNGQCRIDCAGKGTGDGKCPKHMECRDVSDGILGASYKCAYPEGGGSRVSAKYERCDPKHDDGDCKDKLACFVPSSFGSGSGPGYCAPTCKEAKDCTVPGGASAVAACENSHCSLDCSGAGATCPAGMNCRDVDESPLSETFRCRFIN